MGDYGDGDKQRVVRINSGHRRGNLSDGGKVKEEGMGLCIAPCRASMSYYAREGSRPSPPLATRGDREAPV